MVIESPSNPLAQVEVDPTHQALRAALRPLDHIQNGRTLGHYRLSARSGAITGAGVVAGAPLFTMRWNDPTTLLILTFLEAFFIPTVAFTAAQELGLDAILASGFTGNDSAGTAISLVNSGRARRSNMNNSLAGDTRIANATLLTAGVRTLDANPFIAGGGLVNNKNVAAGTEYLDQSSSRFGFRYEAALEHGEHPIVLAHDEGLIVRNAVAFPAAGAATLIVNMAWSEATAY